MGLRSIISRPPRKPRTASAGGQAPCRTDFKGEELRLNFLFPGTFWLVPPLPRHAALARDYATMVPMFIGEPIAFDVMLQRVQSAEHQLNDGSLLGLGGP
jgi:hypothetical protein